MAVATRVSTAGMIPQSEYAAAKLTGTPTALVKPAAPVPVTHHTLHSLPMHAPLDRQQQRIRDRRKGEQQQGQRHDVEHLVGLHSAAEDEADPPIGGEELPDQRAE